MQFLRRPRRTWPVVLIVPATAALSGLVIALVTTAFVVTSGEPDSSDRLAAAPPRGPYGIDEPAPVRLVPDLGKQPPRADVDLGAGTTILSRAEHVATGAPAPSATPPRGARAEKRAAARAPRSAPTARATVPARQEVERPTSSGAQGAAAPPEIDGDWQLTNRIQSTDHAGYRGLSLGYRLELRQAGRRVTGEGRKWSENGRALPERARTPIRVEGEVREDGRVVLEFVERGRRRTSGGTFELRVLDDGSRLAGSFASDVAQTAGSSEARRVR
jgi:hypothetical protein